MCPTNCCPTNVWIQVRGDQLCRHRTLWDHWHTGSGHITSAEPHVVGPLTPTWNCNQWITFQFILVPFSLSSCLVWLQQISVSVYLAASDGAQRSVMSVLPGEVSRNRNKSRKLVPTWLDRANAPEVLDVRAPGLSHCRSQDSVIITCCVLQTAVGQSVQPIQALGGNLPGAPVSSSSIWLQHSEINNQAERMDGCAWLVPLYFRGKEVRV